DGWRVLDRLKNDAVTRHIPVCVISTDDARDRALGAGVLAFVAKPVQTRDTLDDLLGRIVDFTERPVKSLLLVENDAGRQKELLDLLTGSDVQISCASDGDALAILAERRVDGVVLAGGPAALDAVALAAALRHSGTPTPLPAIVYNENESPRDGEAWKRFGELLTVRRVHSPERLLDQVCFFLHRSLAKLPEGKRALLENLHSSARVLAG